MPIRQQVDSVTFYHDEDPTATVTARRDMVDTELVWSFNLMGVSGGNFLQGVPTTVVCRGDASRDAFGEATVAALRQRNLALEAATDQLALDIAAAAVDVQ